MLPGIGGGELVVIALVAILVVGPKDLPKLLRFLGQMVGRLRAATADLRQSFDDMAKETELDSLRAEIAALRTGAPLAGLGNDMRFLESPTQLESGPAVSLPSEPLRGVAPPMTDLAPLAMLAKPTRVRKPRPATEGPALNVPPVAPQVSAQPEVALS